MGNGEHWYNGMDVDLIVSFIKHVPGMFNMGSICHNGWQSG